jgi:thiamine-monophosphate kinase
MKVARLGEFGLIEKFRKITPRGHGVSIGIGDDAACVEAISHSILLTSDLLIENVHFKLSWTSPFALGYKAVAVNLSDIAAMGGVPLYLVLALGLPPTFHVNEVHRMYRGMRSACAETGVSLVGGDTSSADRLTISICMVGHAPVQPVRRDGAAVGDDIFVTGTLGDSALALNLLQSRTPADSKSRSIGFLLRRHHQPTPRLAAGLSLARAGAATAMIDISDGLLQDLGHVCKASGIGAEIWQKHIPVSSAYRQHTGSSGMHYALGGGEDYELLFCAKPDRRAQITKLAKSSGVRMTRIGKCVSAKSGIIVLDESGSRVPVSVKGYDHFARRRISRSSK